MRFLTICLTAFALCSTAGAETGKAPLPVMEVTENSSISIGGRCPDKNCQINEREALDMGPLLLIFALGDYSGRITTSMKLPEFRYSAATAFTSSGVMALITDSISASTSIPVSL